MLNFTNFMAFISLMNKLIINISLKFYKFSTYKYLI